MSNDPRGGGSETTRKDELKSLGEIHHGRKRVQPPRGRGGVPPCGTVWFDDAMRRVVAEAIGRVAQERGYTVWALYVLRNHTHAVVRSHRDRAEVIWHGFAEAARDALRVAGLVPPIHPVWSHRPYKVFLHDAEGVTGRRELNRNSSRP